MKQVKITQTISQDYWQIVFADDSRFSNKLFRNKAAAKRWLRNNHPSIEIED